MLDFGALPPEVNSGRMYAGPGPASMLAAIGAWQAVSEEYHAAATAFGSVIANLTGAAWTGPSSISMAAAATPYATWLSGVAAQAEQTVGQLNAAVAAFETALAATVPPPVIAANRSLQATLIATNILGQNAAAIAATEAHYLAMWAQDAAAMYGYAAASAAAVQVTPFSPPPQSSNPAGATEQAAAVAQAAGNATGTQAQSALSAAPHALNALASPQGLPTDLGVSASGADTGTSGSGLSSLSGLSMLTMPARMALMPMSMLMRMLMMGGMNGANAAKAAGAVTAAGTGAMNAAVSGGTVPGAAGLVGVINGGSAATAGMGGAASVGLLSVPSAWTAGAPALTPTATLASSVTPLTPAGGAGHLAVPPMLPITHAATRGGAAAADAQYDAKPTVIPRSPIGG